MNKSDIFSLWVFSSLAALAGIMARLGYFLFQIDIIIPDDEKAAFHWHRKRRWLAISEILALPLFGFVAVSTTIFMDLDPIVSVLISMVLGALGFGFFLDGLQWAIKKRLGMQ